MTLHRHLHGLELALMKLSMAVSQRDSGSKSGSTSVVPSSCELVLGGEGWTHFDAEGFADLLQLSSSYFVLLLALLLTVSHRRSRMALQ